MSKQFVRISHQKKGKFTRVTKSNMHGFCLIRQNFVFLEFQIKLF